MNGTRDESYTASLPGQLLFFSSFPYWGKRGKHVSTHKGVIGRVFWRFCLYSRLLFLSSGCCFCSFLPQLNRVNGATTFFRVFFPFSFNPALPALPRFSAFMIIFNAKKAVLDLSAVFGQKWSRVLAWMLLVLFGRLTDRPLLSWFKQHPLLGARQNLCRLRGIWFLVGFWIGKWFSIWIWPWIRRIFGSTNFHKPFAKNSWMNSRLLRRCKSQLMVHQHHL